MHVQTSEAHLAQQLESSQARIRELEQTVGELRELQNLFQIVLDAIPVRVFWKDMDLNYLGCNRLFAQDAALSAPAQLIGKSDYDMTWSPEAELYREADFAVIQSGESKINFEEPQTTPDGAQSWLQTSKVPLRDSSGKMIGVLGTYADITPRKNAERDRERLIKELQVANRIANENARLKSEFLATMSHELRTPLNAIEGFTGIILSGMGGVQLNDKAQRYVQRIRANSARLLNLINDFLDLSRIEAGRFELARMPFSPAQLSEKWQEQFSVLAEKKGLNFVVRLGDGLPDQLMGDEEAISKIVLNLLNNAVKFTEQGQVSLTLESQGDQWSISVEDTGIGIPPHAREFIFEEFRQVDQSSKRVHGGTGLGLAIVQKLARSMGGTVNLKSEVGQGSTFTVTLPIETAPQAL